MQGVVAPTMRLTSTKQRVSVWRTMLLLLTALSAKAADPAVPDANQGPTQKPSPLPFPNEAARLPDNNRTAICLNGLPRTMNLTWASGLIDLEPVRPRPPSAVPLPTP
jgi:hypothetical protein